MLKYLTGQDLVYLHCKSPIEINGCEGDSARKEENVWPKSGSITQSLSVSVDVGEHEDPKPTFKTSGQCVMETNMSNSHKGQGSKVQLKVFR